MPHIGDFERFAFIVGAPRSGTTTMSKMLATHPGIAMPFVKEPHYFAQYDLRGLRGDELRERVEIEYLAKFFDDPRPEQRVGADGSVSYLYFPEQMEPILKLWPDSRFIVGVRDPMSLLPSLHKRLFFVGDENIRRFEDAWTAVPDRVAGRRIPRSCLDPRLLRYDEAARYATYLERMFDSVGRERCLVVVFDDLTSDALGQYRRIMNFLDLEPLEAPDLAGEREGRGVRWPLLQRLLKRPPKFLHPYLAGKLHKRRMNNEAEPDAAMDKRKRTLSIRKRLLKWNRVDERAKESVPIHVQQQIKDHFQGEIDRLGELLGRDLSHWLQVDAGSNRLASP